MAKLTLKELLDHKESIKNKKKATADIYVESLDAEITICAPTSTLITESVEQGEEDPHRSDVYLAFNCITSPNLKDTELQKAYECIEPLDIVDAIFLDGETQKIAQEIIKLAGYGDSVSKVVVKKGGELKN